MKAVMLLTVLAFASAAVAEDRVPVLVELFTSEGCSSCPPADELLAKLSHDQPVEGATIVPLSFHVDYWNRLGWVDRFSSPQCTQRQREYDEALKSQTYTPQMIVDGRDELVGSDDGRAEQSIADAARKSKGRIEIHAKPADDDQVEVQLAIPALANATTGRVLLAVTEDDLHSDVRRGENSGRKMTHCAVVRNLQVVTELKSPQKTQATTTLQLHKDWQRGKLHFVAFVQDMSSGQILAVGSVPFQ
jgi:hypothetical protein